MLDSYPMLKMGKAGMGDIESSYSVTGLDMPSFFSFVFLPA